MNKNFFVGKFLLPLGVIILAIDFLIAFTAIAPSFNFLPDSLHNMSLFSYLLIFGLLFFIVGLVDYHLYNKRTTFNQLENKKVYSSWIKAGGIVMLLLTCVIGFVVLLIASFRP